MKKFSLIILLFVLFFANNQSYALIYLGNLNTNKFDPNSIHNEFGVYGSPYNSLSVNNNFGRYGSPYSNYSATNPYAAFPPRLYDQNGVYMGVLSVNAYNIDSISNPFSIYFNMVKYSVAVIGIYGE